MDFFKKTDDRWRTIDSAPRDGTKILSYDTEGNIEVIRWSTRDEKWFCPHHNDKGFWHGVTHWMPLLAPPS
jgi:hypothetical protein